MKTRLFILETSPQGWFAALQSILQLRDDNIIKCVSFSYIFYTHTSLRCGLTVISIYNYCKRHAQFSVSRNKFHSAPPSCTLVQSNMLTVFAVNEGASNLEAISGCVHWISTVNIFSLFWSTSMVYFRLLRIHSVITVACFEKLESWGVGLSVPETQVSSHIEYVV